MEQPTDKQLTLELIRELKQQLIDGHGGLNREFIRGHNLALEKIIEMLQKRLNG